MGREKPELRLDIFDLLLLWSFVTYSLLEIGELLEKRKHTPATEMISPAVGGLLVVVILWVILYKAFAWFFLKKWREHAPLVHDRLRQVVAVAFLGFPLLHRSSGVEIAEFFLGLNATALLAFLALSRGFPQLWHRITDSRQSPNARVEGENGRGHGG